MKKTNGKLHYFGNWGRRENGELVRVDGDGRDEAYQEYKDYLLKLSTGRAPRSTTGDARAQSLQRWSRHPQRETYSHLMPQVRINRSQAH